MALHARTHPDLNVPNCFGCKAASVRVSADAMPSRKADTATLNVEDKRFARDRDAYKRLRAEGLQPPRVTSNGKMPGAAQIEQHARTRDEVEVGRPLPGDGRLRHDLVPH